MSSKVIVIDFDSVSNTVRQSGKLVGTVVPGLRKFVTNEQDGGSAVFFINGHAHEAYTRQLIERFLEGVGIRSVFVTHGLPSGYDLFISTKAFVFDGEHFPVQT